MGKGTGPSNLPDTAVGIFLSRLKKWAQKSPEAVLFPFIGTQTVTPVEREWRDPLPPALFSALCRERNDLAQWRKDFRLLLVRLHGAVHQTDIPVDDADRLAGIAGVFHISFSNLNALDE